jgi:hypothetical protein
MKVSESEDTKKMNLKKRNKFKGVSAPIVGMRWPAQEVSQMKKMWMTNLCIRFLQT